jgi:hypothetical protein
LGTSAVATTIALGNSTGATSIALNTGTGSSLNLGTNAIAHTVTIGNITGATAVNVNTGTAGTTYTTTNGIFTLNTGTGNISLGTDAAAKTINIGTGAVANTITIGTVTASSALALNDDNWSITGGGLATFTPSSNAAALTLTGTNVSSANLAYLNSKNTSGTILNEAYGAAATLAGAVIGQSINLSTNVTNVAQSVTGISLTMPVTSGASTTTLKGLTLSSGAVTNSAGASTWTGLDVNMPAISQAGGGTLTSIGLKITGGAITSGTSYALVTDATAGNVGIGDTTPDHKLDVAGNIGMDASSYINWGDTDGTTGYGFRDNGGSIEFKNSGGSWAGIGSGGGGGGWTLDTANGVLYPVSKTVDVLLGATATSSAKFAFTYMNSGTPIFQTTGVIHTGTIITPPTTLTYNQLGDTATTHTLSTSSDLLVGGIEEINGVLYLNGKIIASSNGTTTISLTGTPTTVNSYNVLTDGSWLVQNAATGGSPGIAALMVDQTKGGDIFTASSSGTTKFTISNSGNVSITGSGTMLTVGGGTGKVDMGTVDPVYNIDGTKYATYLPGMTGIKEETTGTLQTSEYISGVGYRQVLDFKDLTVGSDLWLFSQTTNIKDHVGQMVVLLSPTDNTRTWYQVDRDNYTLSVYSDRPTQVSYRLSAPRFDAAAWSNLNTNPDSIGFEVHSSDLIGSGSQTPTGLSFADFEIVKNLETGAYKLYQDISDGGRIAIEEFGSFANLVAGNIKAGAIDSGDFAAQNLYAFQGTVDNLLIRSGLVAWNIQTELISPIPGGTDVTVQIGSASESGKFAVQNSAGTQVASIDDQGNATFSGTVHSQNIDEIQALLTQVTTDQSVLLAATSSANLNATGSANISELITSDLYVTNQAAVNSLSVTKTITVGSDLVLGSESKMIDGKLQIENTLDSLSAPLKIQSLAMAPVEIMAGLVTIDTHGNVNIAGDLVVAGRIKSSGLTIQDQGGAQVAQVNASGSASFQDLAISGLAIASDSSASDSAVVNGVITTNATAGKAIIPAGVSEITIKNPKVSDYTLVYITPTSSTLNNVLYVKSKEAGQFVVGFTDPISADVSFNWWIIEAK